jgi:hypothetical protein
MSDFSKAKAADTWDEMTDILLAYGAADGNGRMAQRFIRNVFLIDEFRTTARSSP